MVDVWGNGVSSPYRTSGYNDQDLRSTVAMPVGRTDINGNAPIRFTAIRMWLAGESGTRQVRMYCYGNYTSVYTLGAGGSATLSGWHALSASVADSSSTSDVGVGYDTDGTTYFGRSEDSGRSISGWGSGEYINCGLRYVQVPNGAGIPTVTPQSNGNLSVSWSAPTDDGDDPVSSYNIWRSTSSSMSGASKVYDGSSRSFTDSSVSPNTTYYYRGVAKNSVGTSVWGGIGHGKTYDVPSAPTITLTNTTTGVTVSWSAPANGGSSITGYTIDYGTTGSFGTTKTTTSTSYNLTGLTKNQIYYVRVRANNGVGNGDESATKTITTWDTPNAPASMSISTSPSGFVLTWPAPTDNGGTSITNYTLDYGTTTSFGTTVTVTSPTATLSGLAARQIYYFRVRANNGVGSGDESATYNATTWAVPTAPTSFAVTASPTDGTKSSMSWGTPSDGGGTPITGYTYQYSVNSDMSSAVSTTANVLGVTVTGLTLATTYYYRVRANNSVGYGAWSSILNATQLGLPGGPTGFTVTPGAVDAALAWTTPGSTGGTAITGYTIQRASDSGFTAGLVTVSVSPTPTTATITSLTPGVTYWWRVGTVTSAGTTYCAAVSARQNAGGYIRVSGAWLPLTDQIRYTGAWYLITDQIREGGVWKPML